MDEYLPSYQQSVFIGGGIVGGLAFLINIISGYLQISSAPSTTLLGIMALMALITCLVGMTGGLVSAWHYSKLLEQTITLGKGALIGLLTGVILAVVSTLLSKIWTILNPDFNQQIMESVIASFEQLDLPKDQKKAQIDMIYNSMKGSESFGGIISSIFTGAIFYGILNALTGMLGVKLFIQNNSRLKDNSNISEIE